MKPLRAIREAGQEPGFFQGLLVFCYGNTHGIGLKASNENVLSAVRTVK